MRRQFQKSSSHNQEALEPPKTLPSRAEVRSYQNDDVDRDDFSIGNLRSFYRDLCEEEMAKMSPNASVQSGNTYPPRRGPLIYGDSASASTSTSASPGTASVDSASSSPASTIPMAAEVEEIGESERDVVVIVTYSRSPCEDFRRSMEEIVAARVESGGVVDREFMEGILFRYLELNNDRFSRDILRAFLELIGASHEDNVRTSPRERRWRWSAGFSKKKLKLEIKNMQKLCCKYRC